MHAYILEPYRGSNTRYKCPSCGETRQFTRYIHAETKEYLAYNVGICNRINNCGYHYSPKQYLTDNPTNHQRGVATKINATLVNKQQPCLHTANINVDYIPRSLFDRSLAEYDKNNFALGLEKLFGTQLSIDLLRRFYIGTAKNPAFSTIFWQLDDQYRVRTGKTWGIILTR